MQEVQKYKISASRCCNDASSTQGVHGELPVLYAHGELFDPKKTMIERMSESTSSASNMHVVVDDNNNPNKNMIMDAMRMNQGHAKQMVRFILITFIFFNLLLFISIFD
jgi:hypothetical protein